MSTAREFFGIPLDGPSVSSAAPVGELLEVFQLLKPRAAKTPLVRIGANVDGSYPFRTTSPGLGPRFSPGVNRIKYFEDYLADVYGITSHMCDFTCRAEDFTTPLRSSLQTFIKKWLDANPGEDNISLQDWVLAHEPPGDLLLQMDIEGVEYRNLLRTPNEILARFRVIVLEVHGLRRMLEADVLRQVISPFFDKLATMFTVVHAHPNNCCGDFGLPESDIRVPNVLELTLVRNDRFIPGAGSVLLPHPLDVSRNVPRNAPLVLSDAWCDHDRPLESRVKVIEDELDYGRSSNLVSSDQLSSVLSLTMQSIQSIQKLVAPASARSQKHKVVEVAVGKPFRLSSAYGSSPSAGVVRPSRTHFFHTGFGAGEWIEIDLGRNFMVTRIEVANRRDGYQARARNIFALLEPRRRVQRPWVFPMYKIGARSNGSWRKCAIEIPAIRARYVTITAPVHTALHFSNVRVHAISPDVTDVEDLDLASRVRDAQRRILRGAERGIEQLAGLARSAVHRRH